MGLWKRGHSPFLTGIGVKPRTMTLDLMDRGHFLNELRLVASLRRFIAPSVRLEKDPYPSDPMSWYESEKENVPFSGYGRGI